MNRLPAKPERILCAALWLQDAKFYEHQPRNITKGFVICGLRHNNCFATLKVLGYDRLKADSAIQGFLTSANRFVARDEGAKIAFAAGQTAIQLTTLFSEDLY